MKQIVKRYLTLHPKLRAARDLKAMTYFHDSPAIQTASLLNGEAE